MNENDKELLMLAAKAVGFLPLPEGKAVDESFDGGLYFYGGGEGEIWGPLTDYGDALHLALVVGMTIYFDSANQFCMMEHGPLSGTCAFWGEGGDHSDVCEAITWLAAQVGKAMP